MATVTTMRGKRIDITQILAKYENTIAIGNLNMNARGDLLGPGGKVIKRNEEIVSEYYRDNPKAVKQVSLRNISADVFESPAAAVADAMAKKVQEKPREESKTPPHDHKRPPRKIVESED